MRHSFLAWVVVMGLAPSVLAQPPGEIAPVTAAFLEKRVPEELAIEGVVLSRRNLGLLVEQLANKWLISLTDLTTGRVVASTKVDALPADREAAVAAMTHVVAELAAQVVGHPDPTPAADPAPADPAVEQILREQQAERAQRAEREQREAAERAFNRQTLRFSATYDPTPNERYTTPRVRWVVYQGEPDEELDPRAFYREVGRPDLADAYISRRNGMIASFVAGGIGFATSFILLFYEEANHVSSISSCFGLTGSAYDECIHSNDPSAVGPLVLAGAGAIGIGAGIYLATHRQPIEEAEARSLADAYNQRLRGRTSAPPAPPSARLRDVHVTPYVAGHAGGVVLGARF